ncbi:hypothetical protein Tsubulata_000870 [Turnera subulata]|uniref:Protein PHLOEM PROTEIN 2-LIKE A10 n=1 Tax=Turnera subulata TaxID=218843 RepID=A0A9Q0G6A3_9ROSI|nr:hypothetical protein Tsubulata_000870 [Turnera subulata]
MELGLMKKGLLDYTRRRKRSILLLAALGFSTYGAYRVYHLPSLARKRNRIAKLLGGLVAIAEAISDSADTIRVLSNDLKDFLQSESDQIPNSVKQISKIARSNEFSDSVVSLTQALTVGILRGYDSNSRIDQDMGGNANPSFLEKVFDKLSTPAGSGFVSVVVGSFARNLVLAFYQGGQSSTTTFNSISDLDDDLVGSQSNSAQQFVDVVCNDKCKELIGDCVQLFVSTAVAVFLDKTMHINVYDQFFEGLTNPTHEKEVRDVLVSVCNGAIETLVKTSHQVLTSADSKTNSSPASPCLAIADQEEDEIRLNGLPEDEEFNSGLKATKSFDEVENEGWVGKVSSTLAVPSNRRLVLDVTGRVTFETVRSFLEFLLEKIHSGIERCVNVVHEFVVGSGLEVVRYVKAQSSAIATICFSLCLHIFDGAWVLAPALRY